MKSLTAALKLSEIREALNALNAVPELSDTQKTEEGDLLASQKKTESEYRSAIAEEDDARTDPTPPDTEERERLRLVSRASLGAIFARAVEHRSTEGAESELQAALDLAPNQVPIDLLRAPVEHRAITPPPSHVGASEQPVLMPIFAAGDAAFLNVDQVTVPNGDAVFPVLTNRPTVAAARRLDRGRRNDGRVFCGVGQTGTAAVCLHVPARRRGAIFGHGRIAAGGVERGAWRIFGRADRLR